MSKFLRQLGIYNPDEHKADHVTLVGCGGIGSFAALGVAKLGVPRLTFVDPDVVEEHNQPNQLFGESDIGKAKVDALAGHLVEEGIIPDANINAIQNHGEAIQLSGLVVSGLDSMSARKKVWEKVKLNPRIPLYLDARLSGEYMIVYAANPVSMDDIKGYEATLHSDDEGEDVSCTARGIIDVGLMVGSIVTRNVRRHLTGREVDRTTIFNSDTFNTYHYGWD